MRHPSLVPTLVALALLSGCVDDPLTGPVDRGERPVEEAERERTPVWFTGTPEVTAAIALVERVLATPHDDLLVIVDGSFRRTSDLPQLPRALIRKAQLVRATACATFGPPRDLFVLVVVTADWRRR
jgi:hypothetical protein